MNSRIRNNSNKSERNLRWLSSGMLHRVVWQKLTNISEVLTASIIRVMSKSRVKMRLRYRSRSDKSEDAWPDQWVREGEYG
jgi:hypothetical protein